MAHTMAAVPPPVEATRLADADPLPFVDALRGLAILLVIWVHHSQTFAALPGVQGVAAYGQMGVQLFFVASAFTLCRSAAARADEPHATRNFYLRRLFRVAPLYWLAIAGYGLLHAVREALGRAGEGPYSATNVLLNLLFVHGVSPAAYNGVVPGGWSISTEMMFYLLFPALLPAMVASRRRWGAATLALWPLGGIALSLLVQAWAGQGMRNNDVLFCSIANQLSVFLVGIAAALLIAEGRFVPHRARDLLGFLGATAATALLLAGVGEERPAPMELALVPAAGGLSFAFLLNLGRSGLFDRVHWLAQVGRLSYSMYICHFVFAWGGTAVVLRLFGGGAEMQALLYLPTLLAVVLASAGVAMLTRRWVEAPGIAAGKRLLGRLDRA